MKTRTQTMTKVPIVNTIATSFQVVVANISHPQSGTASQYTYSAAYYGNGDKGYDLRINPREAPTTTHPTRRPHLPRQQQFAQLRPAAAHDISDASGEQQPLRLPRSCLSARRSAAAAPANYR